MHINWTEGKGKDFACFFGENIDNYSVESY
jgi:hypothetical protein